MEEATGKVLTSTASVGVKAGYTRALAAWMPRETPTSSSGVRVAWTDADDDLLL